MLCIVGELGCGKTLTALASSTCCPRAPDRAARRIELEGRELRDLRERAMANVGGNRMAMIFQEPMTSLNPAYTIGNQLEEALLRHRRRPRSKAREREVLEEALRLCLLDHATKIHDRDPCRPPSSVPPFPIHLIRRSAAASIPGAGARSFGAQGLRCLRSPPAGGLVACHLHDRQEHPAQQG